MTTEPTELPSYGRTLATVSPATADLRTAFPSSSPLAFRFSILPQDNNPCFKNPASRQPTTTNNSPAPAQGPHPAQERRLHQRRLVEGEGTFAVTDPAGLELAQVANLTAAQTQQAIDAAEAALPAWRAMTHKQRSQVAAQVVRTDPRAPG